MPKRKNSNEELHDTMEMKKSQTQIGGSKLVSITSQDKLSNQYLDFSNHNSGPPGAYDV